MDKRHIRPRYIAAAAMITLLLASYWSPRPWPIEAHTTPGDLTSVGDLISLQMMSSSAGWAITGPGPNRLWHTIDGGMLWRPMAFPSFRAIDVFFTSSDAGWAIDPVRHGAVVDVYRTTDAAKTWSHLLVHVVGRPDIVGLYALNQRVAWVTEVQVGMSSGGTFFLLGTTDGGVDWHGEPVTARHAPFHRPVAGLVLLGFNSPNLGFMVSQAGGGAPSTPSPYFMTTNGGRAWQHIRLTSPAGFRSRTILFAGRAYFPSPRSVILTARLQQNTVVGITDLVVWDSVDSGRHWRRSTFRAGPANGPAASDATADFVSGDDGWAFVGHDMYRTVDGGKTWFKEQSNVPLCLTARSSHQSCLAAPDFVSRSVGFSPGPQCANGMQAPITILRTQNGGQDWTLLAPRFAGAGRDGPPAALTSAFGGGCR